MPMGLPDHPCAGPTADFPRAVQYLAGEQGIRQFLDIGTGLPTNDNTHQIAQEIAPESRIVYVDNDRYKSGCAHTEDRRAVVPVILSRPARYVQTTREGGTKGVIIPPPSCLG